MPETLRIVLFNPIGTREMSFRSVFEAIGDLHIIREYSDWPILRETFARLNADMIAIGLDDGNGVGLEVVQHVAEVTPTCGIIGISANTNPNTIIQAMRAGCSQFVCSPVELEDLRNAIDRIRATRGPQPSRPRPLGALFTGRSRDDGVRLGVPTRARPARRRAPALRARPLHPARDVLAHLRKPKRMPARDMVRG